MITLAAQYRRLLFTYPRRYRDTHERELVSTLLDASAAGQRVVRPREATGLILGGLRLHALFADRCGPLGLWGDGLRLAAALSLLPTLAGTLNFGADALSNFNPAALFVVATIVALFRWPSPRGLLLLAADFLLLWPGTLLPPSLLVLLIQPAPEGYAGYDAGVLFTVATPLILPAIAFCVAGRVGPRSRPWPWSALVLLFALPSIGGAILSTSQQWSAGAALWLTPLIALPLLAAASAVLRDTRWGVAGFALALSIVVPALWAALSAPLYLAVLACGLAGAAIALLTDRRFARI
jgi:hypothetical protein